MTSITTIASSDLISDSRAVVNTNFSNLNSDQIERSYLDTDTSLAANSDAKIATQKAVKTYIDTSGGANASTTVRGIVEEATQSEVDAGTASGGTGARLFINPSTVASASSVVKGLVYKKKIEVDATEVTHSNSTTETTLFDVSIPGGTLGTNNAIKFKIYISDFDIIGTNEANFLLKYGATTIATLNIANSSGNDVTNAKGTIEGYLVADGATNAQKGYIQLIASPTSATVETATNLTVLITKLMGTVNGTATEDSTADKTLAVSLDWNNASSSNSLTAEFWVVELIA
jgi:hypothetical protein